jgi:tRNA(Ile)-lysidine synthetase-like protein
MRILYELISPLLPQKYDRTRISILHNFINNNKFSKSGKRCSITSGYDLFVCDKYFEVLSIKNNESFSVSVNNCGEYICLDKKIKISECKNISRCCKGVIYIDLSGFDFNFELRSRQEGDIIQPFGMNGHQKLKKYFNSRKIPNHEKDKIVLLACGSEVLWVNGYGISEKIKFYIQKLK